MITITVSKGQIFLTPQSLSTPSGSSYVARLWSGSGYVVGLLSSPESSPERFSLRRQPSELNNKLKINQNCRIPERFTALHLRPSPLPLSVQPQVTASIFSFRPLGPGISKYQCSDIVTLGHLIFFISLSGVGSRGQQLKQTSSSH